MAASDFAIVEPLFNTIDSVTATFVTDFSSRAIAEATPVVTAAMSLGIVLYGLLVVRGAIEMPVMEFIGRALRISIIVSVATAGGLYQSDIADVIVSTPDELAMALVPGAESGSSAANVIDSAAGQGAQFVSDAFDKGSFFSSDGLVYGLIGVISALAVAAVVGVGAVIIIVAKVALTILVGIGPFFIFALLFEPTKRFFELWTGQVLNYGFVIVLFSPVFGLLMEIFGNFMSNAAFDGTNNVGFTLVGMLVIGVVSVGLLLQVPSIASGLSSGVGLNFYHELRAMRSGAGAAAKGGKAATRGAITAGKAAGKAAVLASGGSVKAAKAAAGYFKGRKAG